jgi:hypothetical protein
MAAAADYISPSAFFFPQAFFRQPKHAEPFRLRLRLPSIRLDYRLGRRVNSLCLAILCASPSLLNWSLPF